jgi:hypothetical protein
MVSDVGAPVLAEFTPLSLLNERHSGPESCKLSEITNPHFSQNRSPVVLSVRMDFFPHRLQVSTVDTKIRQINSFDINNSFAYI